MIALKVVPGHEEHQADQQGEPDAVARRLNAGGERPAGDRFVAVEQQVSAVQHRYRQQIGEAYGHRQEAGQVEQYFQQPS